MVQEVLHCEYRLRSQLFHGLLCVFLSGEVYTPGCTRQRAILDEGRGGRLGRVGLQLLEPLHDCSLLLSRLWLLWALEPFVPFLAAIIAVDWTRGW